MLLMYVMLYGVLFILFMIGVAFYMDVKKLWAKVIVWLLMLPFILSTILIILVEVLHK